MKTMMTLVAGLTLIILAAPPATADEAGDAAWNPVVLHLTNAQARLVDQRAGSGAEAVLVPLTPAQADLLRGQWQGWESGTVTVHVADRVGSSTTFWVVPDVR